MGVQSDELVVIFYMLLTATIAICYTGIQLAIQRIKQERAAKKDTASADEQEESDDLGEIVFVGFAYGVFWPVLIFAGIVMYGGKLLIQIMYLLFYYLYRVFR